MTVECPICRVEFVVEAETVRPGENVVECKHCERLIAFELTFEPRIGHPIAVLPVTRCACENCGAPFKGAISAHAVLIAARCETCRRVTQFVVERKKRAAI